VKREFKEGKHWAMMIANLLNEKMIRLIEALEGHAQTGRLQSFAFWEHCVAAMSKALRKHNDFAVDGAR
jgi:hypothetical protein